ncbi:MAG: RNA methyltransferase [bacterium]|nr:RNA methyltransferase [bacterium]
MKTADNRGFSCVGLVRPKHRVNVGAAVRACGCYGATMLAIEGCRGTVKAATDTFKWRRHMPVLRVDDLRNVIPYDCVPVAVDLIPGARPLPRYCHPERAFYIFGPEDGTLGRAVTDWCRDVVMIPTDFCMNLAATVNVVLYDRLAKQGNSGVLP